MSNIKTHSDYWLDDLNQFDGDESGKLDLDMIRLAEARRAISNFVRILTGKNIPVYFNNKDANLTDGKSVYLSSDIINRSDFDPAVGLALHEGSHVLLTDFSLLLTLWGKTPKDILDIASSKNINSLTVKDTVHFIWNVIEDRYIDNYVFKNAPGYRGYYIALYNRYFNSDEITKMLQSSMYRNPSIEAYRHRICNMMNKKSDPTALPELDKIFQLIDLAHISRLATTEDRINLAFEVCKLIFRNLPDEEPESPQPAPNETNDKTSETGLEGSDTDDDDEDDESIDSKIGGQDANNQTLPSLPMPPENDKAINDKGDTSDFNKNELKRIIKDLQKQEDFVIGQPEKKKVTIYQKMVLDSIEQSGMVLEQVGEGFFGNKIDCIVVRNMTKELIFSDRFPMTGYVFNGEVNPLIEKAVNDGVSMGSKLGKKLIFRDEVAMSKHMRQSVGRIDKRLIAELGYNNERVFCYTTSEKYNDTFIHITVDASSSMSYGTKWEETLKTVVAICKAGSMLNNIRITVSFRTTIVTNSSITNTTTIPYVVFAYDSAKDKFSKVSTLFKYLVPNGMTPEGLAFEAVMKVCKEQQFNCNSFFVNLSDGMPFLQMKDKKTKDKVDTFYVGEKAVNHTKTQVAKIRERNYEILSYYISEFKNGEELTPIEISNRTNFRVMYGQNAKFIDIDNVNCVAKTLNDVLLKKE
jgi:hypothetical protein